MGWYGLSDSEHEIMKYIWKHEEVTLREVVAWLENRGYTWKQQTVYTLLNRLIEVRSQRSRKEIIAYIIRRSQKMS